MLESVVKVTDLNVKWYRIALMVSKNLVLIGADGTHPSMASAGQAKMKIYAIHERQSCNLINAECDVCREWAYR